MILDKSKKIFAQGFCFTKIFIFFVIGSLFGFLFEGFLFLFKNGKWVNHSDLILGPFSTLYGLGVVINLLLLVPHNSKRGIFKTFIYSSLIGGVFEYVASLITEIFFKIKFWDYSKMLLNLNGRTTIPIMISWGIFGTILLKLMYPVISKWIEKIPHKLAYPIYLILVLFLAIDMIISYSAFGRMIARKEGNPPKTIVGRIYDKQFNDDFMYKRFPILKEKI